MKGKHCKLYDENLVRNIMISTGLSVYEFLRHNRATSLDQVCDFVEMNIDSIIASTIEDINDTSDLFPDDFGESGEDLP